MKINILDLNKLNKISGNNFIKKYKNKNLIIKDNNIELKCEIYINNLLFDNTKFYILECTEEKNNMSNSHQIFSIYFFDFIKFLPSFQNIYINSISKKNNIITGSVLVELVIKICKNIKEVKKIFLIDDAKIYCNKTHEKIPLSLYKIIVNNYTFYNKFGFFLYHNNKYIQNKLEKYSKIIGNYKVLNIINEFNNIINFIKVNYNKELKTNFIIREPKFIFKNRLINNNEKKRIIIDYKYLVNILYKYKTTKFKDMIKNLLEKKCYNLSKLFDILNYDNYYKFMYEKNSIYSKFLIEYTKLYILVNNYQWQGYYVKKM